MVLPLLPVLLLERLMSSFMATNPVCTTVGKAPLAMVKNSKILHVHRALTQPQVLHFRHAIHRAYSSQAAVLAEYRYAEERGLLRGDNTPTPNPVGPPAYSTISTQADAIAAVQAITAASGTVNRYYVVNSGRRPGIFASL